MFEKGKVKNFRPIAIVKTWNWSKFLHLSWWWTLMDQGNSCTVRCSIHLFRSNKLLYSWVDIFFDYSPFLLKEFNSVTICPWTLSLSMLFTTRSIFSGLTICTNWTYFFLVRHGAALITFEYRYVISSAQSPTSKVKVSINSVSTSCGSVSFIYFFSKYWWDCILCRSYYDLSMKILCIGITTVNPKCSRLFSQYLLFLWTPFFNINQNSLFLTK